MGSSQRFWELLLGEDTLTCLLQRDNAKEFTRADTPQCPEDESAPLVTAGEAAQETTVPAELEVERLLQMTGDELCKQPALLQIEAAKLRNAQDELAVQNCSLFLASSKALNSLSCSVDNLSATLRKIAQCVQPLQSGLKQFRTESNAAASQEASLHILVSMQHLVSGLLELPSLVLRCSNGGLHDEAVDALMLADEQITALRTHGCCNLRLLDSLEVQMKDSRNSCMKAMLRQLGQHSQLAASIKLIGPLRRLSCSEEQLRAKFLQRRDEKITRERRNAEQACEMDAAQGLCAAAELLRVEILQTAMHYRAIFGTTDRHLSAWLADQVHWFVKLVQHELAKGANGRTEATGYLDSERPVFSPAAVEAIVAAWGSQATSYQTSAFRMELSELSTVYRQTYNAASALRRVQCDFFPAVSLSFDSHVVSLHSRTLESVGVAFARSLDEYDFSPAPLYFGLINSSPWLATCLSAGSSCLLLLRHPPLANLYNSIVETINAYQDCPVASVAAAIVRLVENLLLFCAHKLLALRPAKRQELESEIAAIEQSLIDKKEQQDPINKQAEFFVLCDIFVGVLVPTLASHVAALIPSQAALCPEKVCAPIEEAGLSACATNPFAVLPGKGNAQISSKDATTQ
ncbi:uncharacterized protein LOC34618613 [Cyclospora cayetanensis]|uniref:Conserved oligomeric Golgi complex subunit 8 n=1 Tax=Cyclospora cayetanensis TaxID=88456 RepID=A0A6P6RQU8_9EIME|nr:uncharacterized protein LOC34618613 [Cyclospora cayetanensis]